VRVLLIAVAFVPTLGAATADAQIKFCGPSDRACAVMSVPLDRAGAVPGSITLTVDRVRAQRADQPPLFLIAAEPGTSARRAFPREEVSDMLRGVVQRRDVIVLDQRGTGDSGSLKCRQLQSASPTAVGTAAAACGAALGARRAFYTTADSVADLEALRAGLGYARIALLAESYGTKVALDYAAAYPHRVERLVLQSPVGPHGLDALSRPSFAASARVLRELCRRGCRGVTPDPVEDLTRLVQMLEREPLRGVVMTAKGRRTRASLTQSGVFATFAAGDRQLGIRRRFPAAVRSAVTGDSAPILRLWRLAVLGEQVGPRTRSAATRAATLCEETSLPWAREAPVNERAAQAAAILAAQPSGAFAPFDAATAAGGDVLQLCAAWPASDRPAVARGPLPDIPALILSGSQNVRAPTEEARRIAALFPQGRTLLTPGGGHDLLTSAEASCSAGAVRRFLAGRTVGKRCPQMRITPTRRDPLSLRHVRPAPGTRGRAGRTVAAVRRTYQDALRTFFDLNEDQIVNHLLADVFADTADLQTVRFEAGGLRSGSYTLTPSRGVLRNLGYIRGVRVSGRLRSVEIFPDGVLRVSGREAAHGTLRVRSGVMRGRLGGHTVRARLGPDLFDLMFDEILAELLEPASAAARAAEINE
jgi:pimeloyl-ACP methyl ester carboxylesterase